MEAMSLVPFLAIAVLAAADRHISMPVQPAAELKSVTACSVVTKSEIERALGRAIGSARKLHGANGSTCEYLNESGQVTIAIRHSGATINIAAEIENLKQAFPAGRIREASGIGGRTFVVDLEDIGTQVNVFRGEHDYLLVSVLGFGGAARVATAAERIARTVSGRL
jgi:hypothetical protein